MKINYPRNGFHLLDPTSYDGLCVECARRGRIVGVRGGVGSYCMVCACGTLAVISLRDLPSTLDATNQAEAASRVVAVFDDISNTPDAVEPDPVREEPEVKESYRPVFDYAPPRVYEPSRPPSYAEFNSRRDEEKGYHP